MFYFHFFSKIFFFSLLLICFRAHGADLFYPLGNQVITAARQSIDANQVLSDTSIIDRQQIERAGNLSLADILSQYAGVEITRQGGARGQTSVFLRGSNSQHVLMLIDGMRVGSTTLGSASASWSTLNSSQIERIEIMRSPASALYGADALGGVIQIFTLAGKQNSQVNLDLNIGSFNHQEIRLGAVGSVNFNTSSSEATIVEDNNFFYSWQIARGKSDEFSAVAAAAGLTNVNHDRDGYKFEQYLANFRYQPIKQISCAGSWILDRGRSAYDSTPSYWLPWDMSWQNNLQSQTTQATHSLNCAWQISELWQSNLRFGENSDKSNELSNNVQQSSISSRQRLWQWQNNLQLDFARAFIAAELLQQSGHTSEYQANRQIKSLQIGANSLDHRKSVWQINFRHDNNSQFANSDNVSLAYGYFLSPDWLLSVNSSSAFRAPSFNDLYWPASSYASGNPNLKPEKSLQQQVSLRFNQQGRQFSLSVYQQKLQQLIDWYGDENGFWQPTNINRARIKGVSGQFAGQLASLNFSGQLTRQIAKNSQDNYFLPYRSRDNAVLSLAQQIAEHSWQLDWRVVGKRYADAYQQLELGAYALFNLSGQYYLNKNSSLTLRVNNLFDRHYQSIRNYTDAGRRIDLSFQQRWY